MLLKTACNRWPVLFFGGICALALGICAIVWPGITLLSFAFIYAIFTTVDGAVAIALGLRAGEDGSVWWPMVILGMLAILAGAFAFAWPQITVAVLLALVAVSAIVRGVMELIAAIRLRKELDDEWILVLSGIVSIIFGGLILYRPDAGLLAIVLLIGAYMITLGVLSVALSLRFRRMCHTLAPAM